MAPFVTHARSAASAYAAFEPMVIQRRDPGPGDVVIDIAYCGICLSDIHYTHDEFGRTTYPLVLGHEITGTVTTIGDRVRVGVMVDACRLGIEQYCTGSGVLTHNSRGRDGNMTYGGYSRQIVVDEDFVVCIPDGMPLDTTAPLLCAGITMYSPLRHWQAGPGTRIGFCGLGYVGVQITHQLGARVTTIDLDPGKREVAIRLGADDFRLASDPATFRELAGSLDLFIYTVPTSLDIDTWLGLLALDGALMNTGVPEKPLSVREFPEMVDFCAQHRIAAEIETIGPVQIDEAFRRVLAGDVRFQFVIDMARLVADAG